MSLLNVDKVDPSTGTALELGTSGDTITVPTGAGLTVVDEVKTNKISPASGTAFALGDSGDTFTVPSGATIVNSGTATGFGGGKLGQVIYADYNTNNQIATTTMTDSGLTADITPSATSSKILVTYSLCYRVISSVAIGTIGFNNRLMRDVTQVWYEGANYYANYFYWSGTSVVANRQGRVPYQYLDSPSSTSALTYKVQIATEGSRSVDFCESSTYHQMSLMEILA